MKYRFLSILSTGAVFLAVSLAGLQTTSAQTNVLTWHNDNLRTGQNLSEAILAPGNVRSSTFGLRFNFSVDGKVDAQPLYVSGVHFATQEWHNVVYAVTEHDSVYAFDADTGAQYWQVSVLGSGESTSDIRACSQVSPEIGITSTPVIDLRAGPHGTLFLVAMSKDASGYYHRVHALDLTTGAEEFGGPKTVEATYVGHGDNSTNGTVTFDPSQYKERPGLLLVNGVIYTSWASHCDYRPYTSWMIGYRESNLQQTSVFNFTPNGSDGASWNAGAGPASDAQANIYIALGNGTFDTTLTASGLPYLGDFGNALVKLSTAGGRLSVADYWTMYNTVSESNGDIDLGSGGAMLLPDQTDNAGNVRHLAVTAGKDTNLYVADRDNMGHFNASSNNTLYQELAGALPGGMWSSPAYFNGQVYYASANQQLYAFQVSAATLSSSPLSSTTTSFGYPGTTPSVSAYRATNGIVWATENSNPAVLHAYNAANLATELYNSTQAASSRDNFGPGNKFITPTIANGKVYVGTTNSVVAFGLLSSSTPPIVDGDYALKAPDGLFLDSPSFAGNRQIVQSAANGRSGQEWFFSSQGDGYYTIQNVWNGLLLTNTDSSTMALTPLRQDAPAHEDSQLWSLIASNDGYIIQNKASKLVIDSTRYGRAQGTGIVLNPRNDESHQVWTIQ